MRYTVVWLSSAEADLADIWMNAADRNEVRTAADKIDFLLLTNPTGIGRARSDGRRHLFVSKVGIAYRVSEQDGLVTVVSVWIVSGPMNGRPK